MSILTSLKFNHRPNRRNLSRAFGRQRMVALATLCGALLLMAACTALPADAPDERPDSPAVTDETQQALVAEATTDLAVELGVEPGTIELKSIEAVEWGDSSLGCPEEGMMYAAVITPGYQITLMHDGNDHVYHTGADADGPIINCTEDPEASTPETGAEPPVDATQEALINLAKQDLADQLGVGVNEIDVIAVEAMEWGDSSLGCPQPDMMYAQVVTPGYQITLAHDGDEYVYHTGADADSPVINCTEDQASADAGGDTEEPAPMLSTRDTLIARAIEDLATRQGVVQSAVVVKFARGVEWRDGSLGCAKADMMYPQVITPGYRIILTVDGADFAYHTAARKDGPVKYCQGASTSKDSTDGTTE